MNTLTTTNKAQIMESVLADGDLSKLTAEQRVTYYFQVCDSLGLNPYTRPFDYITLNGKKVLYAKRDCTDQLRQLRRITLAVADKHIEDDLFIVTVRATDASGRSDEDFGAVTIGNLKGELRANAMLKAITKAKRRVTLSICGLGMSDGSEVEDLPGAVVENIELPPQHDERDAVNASVPLKAAAADMPRSARISERAPAYEAPPKPERTDAQWEGWVNKLRDACAVLRTRQEMVEVGGRDSVRDAMRDAPPKWRREIDEILSENFKRLPEEPQGELPDIEIIGADKLAAG